DPARTAGPPLHRGGPHRASDSLLAAGGRESCCTFGLCRGNQSPHQGVGVTQDPARHTRACPARTRAANLLRWDTVPSEGSDCPGSRTRLHSGMGAVSSLRESASALLCALYVVYMLSASGRPADRT